MDVYPLKIAFGFDHWAFTAFYHKKLIPVLY